MSPWREPAVAAAAWHTETILATRDNGSIVHSDVEVELEELRERCSTNQVLDERKHVM